jgi:two-component system uhpT operon response regulator UhpA
MLNAIRQVHEQGAFLSNNVAQEVLQDYSQNGRTGENVEQHLTDRERQVLELIVRGRSNKEIALELEISPKTVSVHRTNLMSKLNVQNTVELIHFATNHPSLSLNIAG